MMSVVNVWLPIAAPVLTLQGRLLRETAMMNYL